MDDQRISRFLSLVLRHQPGLIELRLDAQGWAEVAQLLKQAKYHRGLTISREDLERVVRHNDKQRYAFSADGRRIRANQGHSVPVDLGLPSIAPPDLLFHGTATRHLSAIRRTGLQKIQRRHVHLSPDRETAWQVGGRHGQAVILTIRAAELHRSGQAFFRADNGVWLTDSVPVAFIDFPY